MRDACPRPSLPSMLTCLAPCTFSSQLFRESLQRQGFIEIHTPKLLSGASEGGAAVFHFDYMGRPGCLAQSPQFYKQMAICSDLGRVFEIGPVFRAENSYTHRHLCEFTGLDMEMAIHESYHEVLDVLDALFVHMFQVGGALTHSAGCSGAAGVTTLLTGLVASSNVGDADCRFC